MMTGGSTDLYHKYHKVLDLLFYASLVLFAGFALIRDCESSFWKAILFHPFVSQLIFTVYCILIPFLAVTELIFGFKDKKKRNITVLFLLLFWVFQIYNDISCTGSTEGFINMLIRPASFERLIWIYYNANMYRFGTACLVVACNGKSFRKAGIVFVISQTVLMLIITALSIGGVIPDLVFNEFGRPGRHSLGMHYTLNYISHWFSIALVYCFIKRGLLRLWDYAALLALLAVSLFVCKAQTTSVLLVLLIAGTLLRQFLREPLMRRKEGILRFLKWSFILFAVITAAGSVLCVPSVAKALEAYPALNTFVSRFTFNRTGLIEYFPTLFGVEYPISTWTGTTANADYFFIDNSYVYELLHCGVLVFPVMLWVLWYIPDRLYRSRQGYASAVLFLFAWICVMEYHLADISFNLFWLLALAEIQPTEVTALSFSSKSTS